MGNPATKLQLIDTIEKALLLVFKDLRILSNSLSPFKISRNKPIFSKF